ncbi:MAG: DUF2786 domain-containing protein [Actinomycetes bacterium]
MTQQPLHDVGGPSGDRRLATVRGLLAKAEASEFPEEAAAFFEKASELIARYAIDEALLWSNVGVEDRPTPAEITIEVHPPYLSQKAVLVNAVAEAHGCRAVRLMARSRSGASVERVSVVGFASDLRWVEILVTSLLVQLAAAMLHGQPTGLSSSQSAAWRRSFIAGFTDEVANRLSADRQEATSASVPGTAVVLLNREALVAADFSRRHPRVRSSWVSSGSSVAGRDAGRAAGREASLARGSIAPRRGLPGG